MGHAAPRRRGPDDPGDAARQRPAGCPPRRGSPPRLRAETRAGARNGDRRGPAPSGRDRVSRARRVDRPSGRTRAAGGGEAPHRCQVLLGDPTALRGGALRLGVHARRMSASLRTHWESATPRAAAITSIDVIQKTDPPVWVPDTL